MSLAAAVTTVYSTLTSAGAPVAALTAAGIGKVYDHEGTVDAPVVVTVSPAGVQPTEYQVGVRVYVQDNKPSVAQSKLCAAVDAVDSTLAGNRALGPSAATTAWLPEVGAWVAETVVDVPRSTF